MCEIQDNQGGESYEIKFEGHLDESWAGWFEGMTFTYGSDGTTTMTGENIDQAALHGLLKKTRDLGLPLLSVIRIDQFNEEQQDSSTKGEQK